MNKVNFHTLGCKVNQYETEAMTELFKKKGYTIVDEGDIADVYVVNTCTVTNLSDRKSRQFMRRVKKANPDAIVAVVGCYSQVAPDEVASIEEVDIILGTKERSRIVELCEEYADQRMQINLVEDITKTSEFEELGIEETEGKTRAFLKIQEGCNQFCSYCIIPYARGRIRSRKLENILNEIHSLAQNGFKEIVLTGIHVASYGKDLADDISLIDVLEESNKIGGIERIRLSSIEPNIATDEFLERYSALDKLCNHFHLSLQSGDDTVLKAMNRKYTTFEFREIVDRIKRHIPDVSLTTDIIVGFPGETDVQFKNSYNFAREIGFSKLHVFQYSPRKGTPAAEMDGQIDGIVKKERSKSLIELGEDMAYDFNRSQVGKVVKVLFEEKSKGETAYVEGYTTNYIRVKAKAQISAVENKIIDVKLSHADREFAFGDIILI